MTMKVVAGALVLLVPATVFAQAGVYRWKDKQGRVHFSNVQPAEGIAPEGATLVAPAEPAAPAAEAPPRGEPQAALPDAPPRSGTPGPFADFSSEAFSSRMTSERLKLRRELTVAKRELADANESEDREIARKAVPTPAQVHDRIFIGVTGVEQGAAPDREKEFRERKQKAEKRVEEIRARYAQLEKEAVRRYGSRPDWWLPIE
jgi:hypothetical protein